MKIQTRARQILEHAITSSDGKVAVTARKLSQMAPGAQWFVQVDQLRQHMLDRGMVLDEPLFTSPLLPKGPIGELGKAPAPLPGKSTLGRAEAALRPMVAITGYVALAYGAYRLIRYAYVNTIGKSAPKPRSI